MYELNDEELSARYWHSTTEQVLKGTTLPEATDAYRDFS